MHIDQFNAEKASLDDELQTVQDLLKRFAFMLPPDEPHIAHAINHVALALIEIRNIEVPF